MNRPAIVTARELTVASPRSDRHHRPISTQQNDGRPRADFIARQHDLAMLEARSIRGENTAIVSELPSGRRTLLQEIRRRLIMRDCKVAFVDAAVLGGDPHPEQLWGEALSQFGINIRAGRPNFDALYRRLSTRSHHVLLIQDFQGLLHRPHFCNPDPWGKLRSLVILPGFSLVITSRLDLVGLHEVVKDYDFGSPLFNPLREIVLGPFSAEDSHQYLAHHHPELGAAEHVWILRITGGHPMMLARLGEHLEQSQGAGHRDHRARLHALIRCRQELRHVFQSAWLVFPWQERWLMLRTAITQRCGAALRRPPPLPVAGRVPSHEQLVELLADLGRDMIENRLRGVLSRRALNSLPGPIASNNEYFTGVADLLDRHNTTADFLDQIRRSNLGARPGWTPPPASAPWQFTSEATERLVPRGVLESTAEAPGWRVIPPLFYWWLLDQIQTLTAGTDPSRWLAQHQLRDHVPDAELKQLIDLLHGPNESILSQGAVPLVEGAAQ